MPIESPKIKAGRICTTCGRETGKYGFRDSRSHSKTCIKYAGIHRGKIRTSRDRRRAW